MIALLDLVEEHQEAIESDLIDRGLRWRYFPSPDFTWRDLLVIVRQSPPDSALVRGLRGDDAIWGLSEQLAAAAVDELRVANWQRGSGKKVDFPEPIPRPGVEPKSSSYGKGALPMDEMADWLGWERELAAPPEVAPSGRVLPPRDARGRFMKSD